MKRVAQVASGRSSLLQFDFRVAEVVRLQIEAVKTEVSRLRLRYANLKNELRWTTSEPTALAAGVDRNTRKPPRPEASAFRSLSATFTFAIALFLMATFTLAADKPTIQNVFHTAKSQFHVLSLDLRVSDQSLDSAWKKSVQQFFERRDTDANRELAGNELAQLPTATECRLIVGLPESQSVPQSADFRPRDGRVTLIELTAWLKLVGAGPFDIRGAAPNSANQSAPELDLFAELDIDADERLSMLEVSRFASYLKKRDIDDDGSLSVNELRPFEPPPQMMRDGSNTPAGSISTLLAAASPTERRTLVNVLLKQFDGRNEKGPAERDNKLARGEIRLDPDTFAHHDLDGDGQLDYEELGQFVRRPRPSVSLVVRLDESDSGGRLSIDTSTRNAKLTETQPGRSLLRFGDMELEFRVQAIKTSNSDSREKEFAAADSDNNAYLDRTEIDRTPQIRGLIRLMDSNGDGSVFFEEFSQFAADRQLLTQARIVVSANHQGASLFEIIDSNKNGRISFRELDAASKRFEIWDVDADGFVEQQELPRDYSLTIGLGNLTQLNSGVGRTIGSSSTTPPWFTLMDRNQDGEVVLREFVGPLSYFKKYDRNSDGILSSFELLLRAN